MTLIHLETIMRAPVQRCFSLSLSVDVHADSMAHTNERAIAGVATGMMTLGDTVTWEARHLGMTRRLTSRITEVEPPTRFVDEQVSGPFFHFRHTHEFEHCAQGTRMTDDFDYAVPYGVIGLLGNRIILARYMRRLLTQRNEFIRRWAESEAH